MIILEPGDPITTETLEKRFARELCPKCFRPLELTFYSIPPLGSILGVPIPPDHPAAGEHQIVVICRNCQTSGTLSISYPPMAGPQGPGIGVEIVIRWQRISPCDDCEEACAGCEHDGGDHG